MRREIIKENNKNKLQLPSQLINNVESRYRALYDRSLHGVFVHDLNGKFLDANNALLKCLGYDRKEFCQQTVSSFLDADQLRKAIKALHKVLKQGMQKAPIEYKIKKKNGDYVWLEVEGALIYNNGTPYAIQGITKDITPRKRAEEALKERERELHRKTKTLEKMNAALEVLLRKRELDKANLEEKIILNVTDIIQPYLEKLKNSGLTEEQRNYIDILETNLKEITEKFSFRLSSSRFNFTPTEIQVANLIRLGKKNKDIATLLTISPRTVEFHRENIRKKLNIKGANTSLTSYLQSFTTGE